MQKIHIKYFRAHCPAFIRLFRMKEFFFFTFNSLRKNVCNMKLLRSCNHGDIDAIYKVVTMPYGFDDYNKPDYLDYKFFC